MMQYERVRQGARGGARHWLALAVVLATLVFACEDDQAAAPPAVDAGDRVTITLAVVDEPNRHAALYAIDQGITRSDSVDLDITYLPQTALTEATPTKQYDIVEASPLVVATSRILGLDLIVLSAAQRNLDGTLLFANAGSQLDSLAGLRRKTVGVASLSDTSSLELRYLLLEKYGLRAGVNARQVALTETPPESLPAQLSDGSLDAALPAQVGAFRLTSDTRFKVLGEVTSELRELTGAPVASSVLVTYPDVVLGHADALVEVNRLLAASVAYFQANQDSVIEAVAAAQGADPEYLRWWWQHQELALGDLSTEAQQQLLIVWEAARALGDIAGYPELESVVFNPAVTPTPEAGGP